MNGPFSQLAKYGRGGDTEVGHLTPGEIVIPNGVQTPEFLEVLAEVFKERKRDLGRYTVGGADDSRNPRTGMREFSDQGVGEAGSGGGAETGFGVGFDSNEGQGGGQIADFSPQDQENLGFNPDNLSDTRSVDISAGQYEAALGSWARDVFGNNGLGALAGWGADKIGRMADRPFETAINGLTSMTPIGPINAALNMAGFPTVGGTLTSMGRALSTPDSLKSEARAGLESEPEGPAFDQPGNAGGGDSTAAIMGARLPATVPETLKMLDMPTPTPAAQLPWQQPNYDWGRYGYGNQQRFFSPYDMANPGAGNGAQLMRGPFG